MLLYFNSNFIEVFYRQYTTESGDLATNNELIFLKKSKKDIGWKVICSQSRLYNIRK